MIALLVFLCSLGASETAASRVVFASDGVALVNGRPFFPVGIFTYSLNPQVMAELHGLQFNTIINGFEARQLDWIHEHGLMAICFTGDEWLKAAQHHPALLAWYLTDEPEGHGNTPAGERERYLKLKATDPDHPIGLCHFLFESIGHYKDACDFTMSDVYPVTAAHDVPIVNVGIHIDEVHRVHSPGWPTWAYIQIFGGLETDGGKWAQPLPYEVRCMAYIALVHRATGILYFSYWPQAPRTWDSIGPLNREIHRISRWLVAKGEELSVRTSNSVIQVRARRTGAGGLMLIVNTGPRFVTCDVTVAGLADTPLVAMFDAPPVKALRDRIQISIAPFGTAVYAWGEEPASRPAE